MAGGHQLWAAAGTLFEQTLLADGTTTTMHELTRHQTKRDTTTRKDGTHRHQFYGHCCIERSREGLAVNLAVRRRSTSAGRLLCDDLGGP